MAVTETGHAASRALDDLYRRHGSEVYRYALAVLGNHADAEDVTQTTFLNAYRSLEQGVRPRKPSNWLLTIASNAIKQRFRQEQARPREVELDREPAGRRAEDEDDGPTVGELLAALSRIPPQQRQAIVLREFEGRSYKEIAEIIGVTTSALETLLFRARRSLTEELEHQLTCTEAQLAVSRAADGRLGRKERRRLREHLGECPDCARFARLQQRHRRALRGLVLIPVPLSLSLLKGIEDSAAAATLPGLGAGAASVGTGVGTASATGGGVFAGGLAVKAAALVTAASVVGGVTVVGATEVDGTKGPKSPSPALVKPGGSAVAPGRDVNNGQARGKADAPGQARARGGPAPGQTRPKATATPNGGRSAEAKANAPGQSGSRAEPPRAANTQANKETGASAGQGFGRPTEKGKTKSAPQSSEETKPAKESGRGDGSETP